MLQPQMNGKFRQNIAPSIRVCIGLITINRKDCDSIYYYFLLLWDHSLARARSEIPNLADIFSDRQRRPHWPVANHHQHHALQYSVRLCAMGHETAMRRPISKRIRRVHKHVLNEDLQT